MTENIDNISDEENEDYVKRIERALVLSSIGTAFAVCFLFFNVLLSLTLMQLTGKYSIIPVLISNNIRTSEEITTKEMFDSKMTSLKAITEIYIRRYIENKYDFFKDTPYMTYVWSPRGVLRRVSYPNDYSKFYKNEKALKFKIASEYGKVDSNRVFIKSVDLIKGGGTTWRVSAIFYTIEDRFRMIEGHPRAKDVSFTVVVSYRNGFKNYSEEYLNPLGVIVEE